MERSLAAESAGLWPHVLSVCGVGISLALGDGGGADAGDLFCAGLMNQFHPRWTASLGCIHHSKMRAMKLSVSLFSLR